MSKGILITIVQGKDILPDASNIKQAFMADVVPQIGSEVLTTKIKRRKVTNVIYDYTQIDGYDYTSPDQGAVRVWLFV
jgi:hypothetical protein